MEICSQNNTSRFAGTNTLAVPATFLHFRVGAFRADVADDGDEHICAGLVRIGCAGGVCDQDHPIWAEALSHRPPSILASGALLLEILEGDEW